MQQLITSFLAQTKECSLPGIGKISIITSPAFSDIANKLMLPPTDKIVFNNRSDKLSDDLVKYVASKKDLPSEEAVVAIKEWCRNTKQKLNEGEEIVFETLGSLQKNKSGVIVFEQSPGIAFYQPAVAERVVHKDAEHAVLVGDKETTSSVMNQYLAEETAEKDNAWKIWAIVLFCLAIVLLLFHYYGNSPAGTGNQQHHLPSEPPATYTTP